MPTIKKREDRLRVLDKCLRSTWYSQQELMEKLDAEGFEKITQRSLQNDLEELKNEEADSPIEIRYEGRVKKFKYRDKNYSYFSPVISEFEVLSLKEAIAVLRKHKGLDLAGQVMKITEDLSRRFLKDIPETGEYFHPSIQQYSGDKYLFDLLESCKLKTVLKIKYKPFYREEAVDYIVHPHLLKEYNGRWFLFCTNNENGFLYNLAIDRIVGNLKPAHDVEHNQLSPLEILEEFKSIIGVTIPKEKNIVDIVFKIKNTRAGYLTTKPIHSSQVEVKKNSTDTTFKIAVIPNKELMALLLSYGCDLEVVSPKNMRDELMEQLKSALNCYDNK